MINPLNSFENNALPKESPERNEHTKPRVMRIKMKKYLKFNDRFPEKQKRESGGFPFLFLSTEYL
jgi:hypothetical protein